MSFKRILSFALAVAMCFSLMSTGVAFADGEQTEQTVTFNPNNGGEAYTVELGADGYVSEPEKPSKADADGYRYEFVCWRVGGAEAIFPTSANPGTVFTADYEQYLASGYTFMIEHSGGVAYLDEYSTPISELMTRYTGITQAVPVMLMRGTGSSADVAKVDGVGYESFAEAVDAAQAGDTVELLDNVSLTSTVTISKNLTIALGGNNITATDCRALLVRSGNVEITGSGTISVVTTQSTSLQTGSSVIRVGDSFSANETVYGPASLTIGPDVTVSTDYCYGVTVFGTNSDNDDETTDITLVVNGTVAVTGTEAAVSGNGTSNLSATSITINGTVTADNEYAIYHPGKGTLTVNGTVSGTGGIEAKGGTIIVNEGASITATAATQSHSVNNNGTSTSGYVIAAVGNSAYANDPIVTINGGTISGSAVVLTENESTRPGVVTATSNSIPTDGTCLWVPGASNTYNLVPAVATVNGTPYASLEEALANAPSGATVVLLQDIDYSTVYTVRNARDTRNGHDVDLRNLTLDMNGHTISTINATVTFGGNGATITNGTFALVPKDTNGTYKEGSYALIIDNAVNSYGNTGTVTVTNVVCNGAINICRATVELNNVTASTTPTKFYAVWAENDAVVTINSGTFTDSQSGGKGLLATGTGEEGGATIEVNGGSFTGSNCLVYTGEAGSVQITGGNFELAQANPTFAPNDVLQVSGGTFNREVPDTACAPGFKPEANANGTYGVEPKDDVVAVIGNNEYATLAAAFAEAQAGGTITLLTDVTLSEGIDVANTVTLNMAGHTITYNSSAATKAAYDELFDVASTGNLTITGDGTITGPTNGQLYDGRALIVVDAGRLTIENGTLTATGYGSDGMYGVYILANGTAIFGNQSDGTGPSITSHFAAIGENHMTAPANVTVYGGTYTANANPTNNEWWSYFCAPVYAAGSGTITISGGTFNGYYAISDRYADVEQTLTISGGTFNGSSDIDIFAAEVNGSGSTANRTIKANVNTLDVPDGYMWVSDAQNGYELAVAVAKDDNDVTYASLAEAMAAGGTITLLTDVTLSEGIDVTNTVTLDMAGYTITYNSSAETKAEYDELFDVASTGNLTITGNGTITGPTNGQLYDGRALIVVDAGSLTIENGTLTATGYGSDGMYGVYILANGTAIFGNQSDGTGPSITSHFAAIGENHMTAPAHVTVFGGTYTANAIPTNNEWWSYFCAPVYAAGSGTITISGGTFNGYYAISDRYADVEQTLTISGGTFNGSSNIDIFAAEVNGSGSTANRTIKANVNALSVPDHYEWADDGAGGYKLQHVHEWNDPVIVWKQTANGWTVESCTHTCSICGVTEGADYTFDTRLFQGTYTYTATVGEHSESKTLAMKYEVVFNGHSSFHDWGATVSLTANGFSKWSINGREVADGLQIYTFTVTENSVVTIEASQSQTPQAVISSTLTSTEAGRAVFNVKWSLPTGAQVQSVIAYRGYTSADKDIPVGTLVSVGAQTTSSLRVLNGDYTLRLYDLIPGKYQHAALVITYTLNGNEYTLTTGTNEVADRVLVS